MSGLLSMGQAWGTQAYKDLEAKNALLELQLQQKEMADDVGRKSRIIVVDGYKEQYQSLQRKHSELQGKLQAKDQDRIVSIKALKSAHARTVSELKESHARVLGEMRKESQSVKEEMRIMVGKPLRENMEMAEKLKAQDAELAKLRRQFEVVVQQLNEAKAKLRESESAYIAEMEVDTCPY